MYACKYIYTFTYIYIIWYHLHAKTYTIICKYRFFLHATYHLHMSSGSESKFCALTGKLALFPALFSFPLVYHFQSFPEKTHALWNYSCTPWVRERQPEGTGSRTQSGWLRSNKIPCDGWPRPAWPRSSSISTTHCNSPRISGWSPKWIPETGPRLPKNYRHIFIHIISIYI